MKKIGWLLTALLLVAVSNSCSKSSSSGGGPLPSPPPDPASTGEVKATLTYSTGEMLTLNASGNYTLFNRMIQAAYNDTLLTITGSPFDNSFQQLNIRLLNISRPGTYSFKTGQTGAENAAWCELNGNSTGEYYTTQQVTDPGSVTIQSITSDYVSGTFTAGMTSWYPGRPDAGRQITVTNGGFKGHFTTIYR